MNFFPVLVGNESQFFNIKIKNAQVYCAYCKAYIGTASNKMSFVIIKHKRLIRVDPRYIISLCNGQTRDESDNVVEHGHISVVASLETQITAPIRRLRYLSMDNGRILPRPCVHMRRSLEFGPHMIDPFLQANSELPTEVSIDISDDDDHSKDNPHVITKRATVHNVTVETVGSNSPRGSTERNVTNYRDFESFLQDQPSTSGLVYEPPVRDLITQHKRLKMDDENNTNKVVSAI